MLTNAATGSQCVKVQDTTNWWTGDAAAAAASVAAAGVAAAEESFRHDKCTDMMT